MLLLIIFLFDLAHRFDRARAATEHFQRSEKRLMIRFSLTEGVLSDKDKVVENQKSDPRRQL